MLMTADGPPFAALLSEDDARRFFETYPGIRTIDLLVTDVNGVLRGKQVTRDGLLQVCRQGLRLPGSMFSVDSTGAIVEETGIVAEEGEQDRALWPIARTLSPMLDLDQPGVPRRGQALCTMTELDGTPFFADPRHALARTVEVLEGLGYTAVLAAELELYLLESKPPPRPIGAVHGADEQVYNMGRLDQLTPFLDDVRACCEAAGITTDTAVAESGPGHLELNLRHRADAMQACDEAILFKRAVHRAAARRGWRACFMAKPFADKGGSGLHFHLSLKNKAGRNAFGIEPDVLDAALAGLIDTMGDAMAVFAPNANSYRRLRPGAFVPLRACWGENNRTCALRLPPADVEDRRIEHRVPGADASLHLAGAAVLAGVCHGLANQMTAPGPETGDATYSDAPVLPLDWVGALETFAASPVMQSALGLELHELYLTIKRAERDRFEAQVGPLDHEWYQSVF